MSTAPTLSSHSLWNLFYILTINYLLIYSVLFFFLGGGGHAKGSAECSVPLLLFSHSGVSESLVTPWTVACHDPLSLGFFRQEYWSELPFPPPGDLPDSGIEHTTPACLLPCRWIHYHWIMWAFPDQGSNLGPLLLNHWILTTGPLRNSPSFPFNT